MDLRTLFFFKTFILGVSFFGSNLLADDATLAPDAPKTTSEVAIKEPTPTGSAVAIKQPSEKDYRETLGYLVATNANFGELGFTPLEVGDVVEGFRKGAFGLPCPIDVVKDRENCEKYWRMKAEEEQKKQLAATQKVAASNKEKGNAYLKDLKAKNGDNPNFKFLPSGLVFESVLSTDSIKVESEDQVVVHYKGTFVDGSEFDSSLRAGKPAMFPVAKVIPGFREGLQLMTKGDKAKLYIPSDIGYGDMGTPIVPPGSFLIFDLEIIDVMKPATSTAVAIPAEKPATPAKDSSALVPVAQ